MIPLIKPYVGEEEIEKIKEVFKSGYLTEGAYTREFEEKFAKYIGCKYAIAVTNATNALEMILRCIEVKKEDEIIVPDFTHPATVDAVYLAGAKCVLVDVSKKSRNVTYQHIQDGISDKTKAIMPISACGNPLDIEVYDYKDEYYVIEDAAPSAGAEINGKKVGKFADATVFSFHPRKLLTTGEGGMITTDNEELYQKIKSFKQFGENRKDLGRFSFDTLGTNYKMSNIHAAIGIVQLERLEKILNDRIKKAEYYNKLFKGIDEIETPYKKENTRHIYQSYTLYIKKEGFRDTMIKRLLEKEIQTQIGTYALHLEKAFASAKIVGTLNNSTDLYNNLLTLPLYYEMTKDDQYRVFEEITQLLE
jgi:dTDP-4-amino-4,6-dideoxygalactose transaminase